MTKVKVIERTISKKEIDLQYPVYLAFQDDNCLDQLIMVDERFKIIVKHNHFGITIEKTHNFCFEEQFLKHLTTKEHFDEFYKKAIKSITDAVERSDYHWC